MADLRGDFFVSAPTTLEEVNAFNDIDANAPKHQRGALKLAALTSLCLKQGSRRFFPTPDDVADLDADTFDAVTVSVFLQLSCIAPSYQRSDIPAWRFTLRRGAEDPANLAIGERLACCVDAELGRGAIPRPDRFFGVSMSELTDGQWLVFRAARFQHVERHLRTQQPRAVRLARPG